jgi:uncharacterized alpha-E superfamily protein
VFHRLESNAPNAERVARFLIFNPSHPRSIGYCVREITESLHVLRHSFRLSASNKGLECCDVLMESLQVASHDAGLVGRLHDFNDWVQTELYAMTDAIASSFFTRNQPQNEVPEPDLAEPAPPQTQSQSQSSGSGQTQSQS